MQKIWTLVIIVGEDIAPVQLREQSNKFLWSRKQIVVRIVTREVLKGVDGPQPLTVVQLARVCRTLYEEVALTRLFYKVNHFALKSVLHKRCGTRADLPLNYLVALTPRMKAIQ